MSAATPESPKMIDLRRQLCEASTAGDVTQVMMEALVALGEKKISTAESKVLTKEFSKYNKEQRARLKELRAELESMKR